MANPSIQRGFSAPEQPQEVYRAPITGGDPIPNLLGSIAQIGVAQLDRSGDVCELLRLNLILNNDAPVSENGPSFNGTQIGTVGATPGFTPVFKNEGRNYVIGVRIQAFWNTLGGYVVVAKGQSATQNLAQAFTQIQRGVTQNNRTQQFALLPGESVFVAVLDAAHGGVPIHAADIFNILLSDDANIMSGVNRRFKIAGK